MGRRLSLAWSNDQPDEGVPEPPTFAGWRGSAGRRRLSGFETIRTAARPELLHLRLHTSDGWYGLGEAFGGGAAVEAYLHEVVAPRLFAADPARLDRTVRTLLTDARATGDAACRRGVSAVDLALWDLAGRVEGRPVHELLGGACRERIRIYSSFPRREHTPQRGKRERRGPPLDAVAGELAARQITAMKVPPFEPGTGAGPALSVEELDRALRPLREVRSALGPAMDLILEFDSRWDLATAKRIARAVEELDPYWLEEPVRADDIRTVAAYARAVRVPMSLREPLASRYALRDLFNRRIAGVVTFSLGWSGGLSEGAPVASQADSHHLPLTLYGRAGPVLLAAATQLAVSAPNALIQETVQEYYSAWYHDVVAELPEPLAGTIGAPDGPGLGVDLAPDLLRRKDALIRRTSA